MIINSIIENLSTKNLTIFLLCGEFQLLCKKLIISISQDHFGKHKGALSRSFCETSISLITELENTSNDRSYRYLVSTEANIINTLSESESSNIL